MSVIADRDQRVGYVTLTVAPELPELPDRERTSRELRMDREAAADRESRRPAWSRDAEWTADMEYVWAEGVRPSVAALTARAKRYKRAARELADLDEFGGRLAWLAAPGVRVISNTRQALRAAHRDGRRIVVRGAHGCITPQGRRIELLRAAEWAENRARAASMSRVDLVGACRGRWRKVGCGCGTVDILVGCEQTTLCEWCRKRHWRRWRRRITRAMDSHLTAAKRTWAKCRRGYAPGVYLITLTAPHSGNLATDRETLGRAWRELSKAASYGNWWAHHAMVYEATPGTKGDGHMHMHVAVISSWIPYDEIRALWGRAIPGAVHVDFQSPADAREAAKLRGRKANEVSNAAEYLAKYVTKGVEPIDMTGRKAGELLVAFRGRRKVTTSRHFWRPLAERRGCQECGEPHRLIEAPCGLIEHAPGAVLASMAERSRWRPPRGAPQVPIRWDCN